MRPRFPLVLLLALAAAPAAALDVLDVVPRAVGKAFAPGPPGLGFQGLQADPNTIANFDGTVALAYLKGRATDGTGHVYKLGADMRIFQGTYVAADATMQHGTFGFI